MWRIRCHEYKCATWQVYLKSVEPTKKSQTKNRGDLQPQQNHQPFLGLNTSQMLTITFSKE